MSERNKEPLQAPDEGAQQASRTDDSGAFQRAENVLAAGNEDLSARNREAMASIENRPAKDEAPKTAAADALTQRGEGDQEADDEMADDLAEKAREEGVEAAGDAARIEWGQTPHSL